MLGSWALYVCPFVRRLSGLNEFAESNLEARAGQLYQLPSLYPYVHMCVFGDMRNENISSDRGRESILARMKKTLVARSVAPFKLVYIA